MTDWTPPVTDLAPIASSSSLAGTPSERQGQRAPASTEVLPGASALAGRAARACSSCNRQKVRCDGRLPCQRCITLKLSSSCEYRPSLRGKTRRKQSKAHEHAPGHDSEQYASLGGEEQTASIRTSKRSRSPGGEAKQLQSSQKNARIEGHEVAPLKHWQLWCRSEQLSTGASLSNTAIWGSEGARISPRNSAGTISYPAAPSTTSHQSRLVPSTSAHNPKLTSLPLPGDSHNPLAVLAEASATSPNRSNRPRAHISVNSDAAAVGSDSATGGSDVVGDGLDVVQYYAPLERTLKDEAPHIMSYINVHEAEQLFDTYFKYLHPYMPVLDRRQSSPSAIARRANYLFNAICCVAARASNIVLWERLKDFARFEMERFPRDKTIEVVQAHLLYTTWNLIRPKHFEQDLTWVRAGIALRTAIDINLHRIALVKEAKEGLPPWLLRSIARTWLLAYVTDRTLSAQLGKASSMRGESSVGPYVELLSEGTGSVDLEDVWTAALAEWTQILARAMDVLSSEAVDRSTPARVALIGNQNAFPNLIHVFTKQLRVWSDKSEASVLAQSGSASDALSTRFTFATIKLYEAYAKLIVLSFGLMRAAEVLPVDLPSSFAEYQIAATRLIDIFDTEIEAQGLTRGCPDFIFTVLTYGAVSLLKAAQPQFVHLEPDRAVIFTACRKASDMLARAATSPGHLPASLSIFLSRLIDARANEEKTFPRASADPTPQPINLSGFARSVAQDPTRALWPPMPAATALNPFAELLPSGMQHFDAGSVQAFGGDQPLDLNSWVMQSQAFPIAGAATGALGTTKTGDELFSHQDDFWRSLFEGTPVPSTELS